MYMDYWIANFLYSLWFANFFGFRAKFESCRFGPFGLSLVVELVFVKTK